MKPLYKSYRMKLLPILTALLLGISAFGNKVYVTSTLDNGPGTLRDLIGSAINNDTIMIDIAGTLYLQSQIQVTKHITIIGPGPIHFVIDGTGVTAPLETGFGLISGSPNLKIEGVRFTNFTQHCVGTGSGYTGTFTAVYCHFDNNNTTAINVDGGNISIEGCSFINNVSGNEAGVSLFSGSSAKFVNCTFNGNDAGASNPNGGALSLGAGNVDIVHCTFFENGLNAVTGKAILVDGASVTLRNNIIYNLSQSDELVTYNSGSVSTVGGNIMNDNSNNGFIAAGNDNLMVSVPGIGYATKVVDGWGLTYFPLAAGSPAIDISTNTSNLPLYDQRHVWRVMDGGASAEMPDAGAVEYSKMTITTAGISGPGTLLNIYTNVYSSSNYVGKAAFVFEISGAGPFNCPTGSSPFNLLADSTIFNGFSQSGSRIPGPGITSNSVSGAYTSIMVNNNAGSNYYGGFNIGGAAVVLAGVAVQDYTDYGAFGVSIFSPASNPASIVGCHIGVSADGLTSAYNTTGIIVNEFYGANIGASNYVGNLYHNNRNVISTNQTCQIRVKSGEPNRIARNFIGLNAQGLDRPTGGIPASGDTGIAVYSYSTSMGTLIGGPDFTFRNIIGDQDIAILLASENNKVFNNFIGTDLTGNNLISGVSNGTGLWLNGFYSMSNIIGELDKGNVFGGSTGDAILINGGAFNNRLYANHIGIGSDGISPVNNDYKGIWVVDGSTSDTYIGDVGKGNVIGNNSDGIVLENSYHSIIRSNLIGIAADTTTVSYNTNGIMITFGSSNNMIGGCNSGEGNIIGGSGYDAIIFQGLGAGNDTVFGNYLGVTPGGVDIGNGSAGIYLADNITNIQIGNATAGCGNTIAYNYKGIETNGAYNSEILISGNSFHDNIDIGIDIDGDGQNAPLTSGAPGDNNGAQTPSVLSAVDCGGGTVDLELAVEWNGDVLIEVYESFDGQEGGNLISQQTVTFSAGVNQVINIGALVAGTDLVVTGTYDTGSGFKNTSEFSSVVTVTSGTPPAIAFVGQDSICYPYGQTVIDAPVTSGATYYWEFYNGATFDIVSAFDSTSVVIEVGVEPSFDTDSLILTINSGGCVSKDTLSLYLLFAPNVDYDSVIQPTTCGGFGEVYLATWAPSTTYTVYYNSGSSLTATTSADPEGMFPFTNLLSGTYVIDSLSNGICSIILDSTYTFTDPLPPTADAGLDQTICAGSTAVLTGTGTGTGSLSYAWDNGGGTSATASVIPAVNTTYTLTVTDNTTLCTATDQAFVIVNANPSISIATPPVLCEGAYSYTYDATITGMGTYTYSWSSATDFLNSTVEDASLVSTLFAGTYTHGLSVVDGNGCSAASNVNITINPIPSEGNPFTTNVTCFGGTDGAVMIAPSGSYTFNWTGPNSFTAVTQDISGLEAGTYNLVITDGDGCVGNYSTNLTQPSSLPNFTYSATDLICNGDGSGNITFGSETGTSPFSYSIDNGGSYVFSNAFTGLMAGSYNLMITDGAGCISDPQLVVINEPAAMLVSAAVTSNYNGSEISCFGAADGEITSSVSGGTPTYNYDWTIGGVNAGTSAILTGGVAGAYTLTVTDFNGCVAMTNATLVEPTAIGVSVANITDPSCSSYSDGSVESIASGGTGSTYSYNWYSDAAFTSILTSANPMTNIAAGDYYAEAVDINGCIGQFGPVTVTDPAVLLASFGSTHETCYGLEDGSLYVQNVTGGNSGSGYTTEWFTDPGGLPVGTADSLTAIVPGNYSGTVTDANGCTTNGLVSVNLGETYSPVISMSHLDSCINNNSFDFAEVGGGPSTGVAGYQWTFTNASPGSSTAANPSGVVFNWISLQGVILDLTSNGGCVFRDTVYADIYDTASISLVPTDVSCFGYGDGTVTANATGGFGPYQYSFNSGTPTTSNVISGLNGGTVTCYVIDTYSGCQSSVHTIGIAEPTPITFDTLVVNTSCGVDNGSVEAVNISGGTVGYTVEWFADSDYVVSLGNANPSTGLAPSDYYVIISDGSSCYVTGQATVSSGSAIVPTPTIQEFDPYLICNDGSGAYGMLTVQSNDDVPGSFSWYINNTNGAVIGNADSLLLTDSNIGNQFILVTEFNGTCYSAPDTLQLIVESSDVVDNSQSLFCLGDEVSLDLSTAGSFYWTSGTSEIADTLSSSTTALPTSSPAVYHYEVYLGSCIFMDSVVIAEDPDCEVITITNNAFSPDGDGVNDLFIIDVSALLSNENTVVIINRWGDIIREYSNYDNTSVAWDGTNNNGQQVPEGTYFYIVRIPALDFQAEGWIQVVR